LFGVNWNYVLNFSAPGGSVDPNANETFALSINSSDNPTGDTMGGFALARLDPGLILALNGVSVSNFRYEVVDGSGYCDGVDTSLPGTTWYNCEDNTASLYIKADFRDSRTQVPEPTTLALHGLGLAGSASHAASARPEPPRTRRSRNPAAAVVLLGPRQVGKTTLALAIAAQRGNAALYLDLERPADRRRLLGDPDAFLRSEADELAIIDGIHRAPDLFPVLRGIIDEGRRRERRTGRFLLLGSAALDLMRQASESLAGRVEYVELAPIDVVDYAADASRVPPGDAGVGLDRLWVRGGFPESLFAADDEASLDWRRAFIRSYLERDVPMFAPRLPSETIGRLWTMLAHSQGTPLNQARLAGSLAVTSPSVGRYVDLLVDLLLLRRLRPWSGNVGKRLVRSPKTYVRDSGLVHALLDLGSRSDILGHPVAGASWEGFVIESLIAAAGERRTPYFYRTEDGAEVDLVFERGGVVEMAIEIKRSSAPVLSRGFRNAEAVLQPRERYLVHGGTATWTDAGGVVCLPLLEMTRRLLATS
jgi:hypothetical protein